MPSNALGYTLKRGRQYLGKRDVSITIFLLIFDWNFRYLYTMVAEKIPIDIDHVRRYETELKTLYARRSTIDDLIESLKDYDKYRARPIAEPELKTA